MENSIQILSFLISDVEFLNHMPKDFSAQINVQFTRTVNTIDTNKYSGDYELSLISDDDKNLFKLKVKANCTFNYVGTPISSDEINLLSGCAVYPEVRSFTSMFLGAAGISGIQLPFSLNMFIK